MVDERESVETVEIIELNSVSDRLAMSVASEQPEEIPMERLTDISDCKY